MLDVLSDEVRPQLAQASQLTEFLRRDDITYQAELQWWTTPFAASAGVPPETLASAAELQRVDVAREFPRGGWSDRRAEVMMEPQVLVRTGIAPFIDVLPAATPRRSLNEILQLKEAR